MEPLCLSLRALKRKLSSRGFFTLKLAEQRAVFSLHAIHCNLKDEMRFHGRAIHTPQDVGMLHAPKLLAWNAKNVFKTSAQLAITTPFRPRAAH
jgi:hypothetical protein